MPILLLLVILFMSFGSITSAQSLSFHKINSGTKADIITMMMDKNQDIYFLTDKIYKLNDARWKRLDFQVEGKISEFYPLSDEDIWFTVNQVTNTSQVYHFHQGITENIRSPFANQISSIYFISKDSALFTSLSDVAVYEGGSFRMLSPAPTWYAVVKFFCTDLSSFWALGSNGELLFYHQGKYEKVLEQRQVIDFCFKDIHNGFILTRDELFRLEDSNIKPELKNSAFQFIEKIQLSEDGTLLMAGDTGLILGYSNGQLSKFNLKCKENLTGLVSDDSGNILICGENGRMIYSGQRNFPGYTEDIPGFSSYKLITYGITTDDEYGVAMADFNNDERTDIYAVRIYEQNRLYINEISSGKLDVSGIVFSEEVVRRNAQGILNPKNSASQGELKLGIAVADIDNDDDQDIYLCYLNSSNKLLINKGDGFFRNVSEQSGRACENMNRSNAAAFADVENDGDLDLFITNEEGSNRLYENNGTGGFTDITSTSGVESVSGGMCAAFSDVNNDGLQDLCVSFWYPSNKLYINESVDGKIIFRDITHLTDLANAPSSKSNAVTFADVNNDGYSDLFIASRNSDNKFYQNDGHGFFTDKTTEYFPPEGYLTNGAVFADFDLDGFQDLYITNVGENVLYKNISGSYFIDVTAEFGAELSGYCTGCATGDIDDDGDPDLYVANYINGNSQLFRNNTESKNFVKFRLHGVRSNKDAIGSKIWLYEYPSVQRPAALVGYRELRAGEGYASTSSKELIFGIKPESDYFALIRFPSTSDTLRVDHVSTGRTYEIRELTGLKAMQTEVTNRIIRFITDRELLPEIFKFILIALLLIIYNIWQKGILRKIVLVRRLACVFIFIVFIFINRFFLFHGLSLGFFIAPVIVLGLLAFIHLLTGRILLRRQAQREKLDLREKLSRDLHDDLASTLGSISIYAGTLNHISDPSPADTRKLSRKISGLTQMALQSISDIIWMTSPRNDTLQSLISKISNYMLEILIDNRIEFIPYIEVPDEPVILPEEIRNDTFLILKEALNNTIRHSGAGVVRFRAGLTGHICSIRFMDNGKGIDGSNLSGEGSHGNGLINMRRRAQESGISFVIKSKKDSGTEIILQFKI
jgi:enediyne biosynthesis protein E4